MKIIIAGGGKVGSMLTRQLSAQGHDITVIDSDAQVINTILERYDVFTLHGNCASMRVLEQAGVKDADVLIAATNADELNLLCCSTAHFLNDTLKTIGRIRNPEYIEQIHRMEKTFGLSMVINPELQAAAEIERLLKYPVSLRRDTLAKGHTEIVELPVDAGSKLCNVCLKDLRKLVKCQVLVCAVIRDGSAVAPRGDFELKEGDRIFVTALSQNLSTLLKNLGMLTRIRNVTICGGGRTSYYLARALNNAGVSTRIIEKSPERVQELQVLLPRTTILTYDVSEVEFWEEERQTQTDAMVTLTGQDELNMIASLYAGTQGIPKVITKLSSREGNSVISTLNLGSLICPRELACGDIVRYVRAMGNKTGEAISVHTIADGQIEAMEFVVNDKTRHRGTPLKNLRLKPNVLLVSITTKASTQIANGDSVFQDGDTVVVVTNGRQPIRQFNDIFA